MNSTKIKIINQRSSKVCIKINSQKIDLNGLEVKSIVLPSKYIQVEGYEYGFWPLKFRKLKAEVQDNSELIILKYSFSTYTFFQFLGLFIFTLFGAYNVYTNIWSVWILIILLFFSIFQILFLNDIFKINQT